MGKDARTGRVQSVKLTRDFYAQDLHKSMFINDLCISLPKYYAVSWPANVTVEHKRGQRWKDIDILYKPPRSSEESGHRVFKGKVHLLASKGRGQFSSYRLHWGKDLAVQLAQDYPKSFVRALEFHLGDAKYKDLGYTEFDIGGFKEQVQIKVEWGDAEHQLEAPRVTIKEYFQIREDAQFFPNVYKEMSSFLIAEHLVGDQESRKRRLLVSPWRDRAQLPDELKENVLYILGDRENSAFYIGQTKESLARRYPAHEQHHSWDEWKEYCVMQLPDHISSSDRVLMERVLIEASSMLFNGETARDHPLFENSDIEFKNKTR